MAELKYEITPENAPRFAAMIAEYVEQNEGVAMDYSVESLETVDGIIGSFHNEGVSAEEVEVTLFEFGCYVGEVFVRNAVAKWRAATQDEIDNLFGVPLVLQMGKSDTVNPIGKVIKRLENGDEDNLPYFYRAFAGQRRRPWWRFWQGRSRRTTTPCT
jgi:hypothetical protein